LSNKWALAIEAQGPMTSAKNAKAYPTYDINITYKQTNPELPIFFQCKLEHLPHFWGFEQFSSSIDWQITELQSGVKIAAHMW